MVAPPTWTYLFLAYCKDAVVGKRSMWARRHYYYVLMMIMTMRLCIIEHLKENQYFQPKTLKTLRKTNIFLKTL